MSISYCFVGLLVWRFKVYQVKILYRFVPYRFPGIFSSIDSYTKNIVERYVEKNGELPEWMDSIGDIKKDNYDKAIRIQG